MPETPPLPPGFVLDQPQGPQAPMPALPPGFVLDAPGAAAPAAEPAAQETGLPFDIRNPPALQRMRQPMPPLADIAPTVATMGGAALGSVAGPAGTIIGAGAGNVAGEHLSAYLRGEEQPGVAESAIDFAWGAGSGVVGKALQAAFRGATKFAPSMAMQERARAVERAFRGTEKLAPAGKKGPGFSSPEAKQLWQMSKRVEQIENAIRVGRGKPDRIREQFSRLANNNRFMKQLTPDQQALIVDLTHQNTAARVLRTVGDLRSSMLGGVGSGMIADPLTGAAIGTGQLIAGQGGRALDAALTTRATNRALSGLSGVPAPVAIPSPGSAAGYTGATDALVRALRGQ